MKFWSAERQRFEDSLGNEVVNRFEEVGFSAELQGPDIASVDELEAEVEASIEEARAEGQQRADEVKSVAKKLPEGMCGWPKRDEREEYITGSVMDTFHRELEIGNAKAEALDKHYTDMAIQPMAYALANNLDPAQQTILKYISRYRVKHGVRDLKAAAVVLEKYIAYVENGMQSWDDFEWSDV